MRYELEWNKYEEDYYAGHAQHIVEGTVYFNELGPALASMHLLASKDPMVSYDYEDNPDNNYIIEEYEYGRHQVWCVPRA